MTFFAEPRTQAALDAAIGHAAAAVKVAVDRLLESGGHPAGPTGSTAERDHLLAAQLELRRGAATFHRVFRDVLTEQVRLALQPPEPAPRRPPPTDWSTLSLVDDRQVEDKMEFDRIGQQIADACEWEVREVSAHFASLIPHARADGEAGPLRPRLLGTALYRAAEAITPVGAVRQALSRAIGQAAAEAMREGYRYILRDLQARGVQASGPTVRMTEGPGTHVSGYMSGFASVSGGLSGGSGAGELHPASERGAGPGGFRHGTGGSVHHGLGGARGSATFHGAAGVSAQADQQLMTLLRRLTSLATRPGTLDIDRPMGGGSPGSRYAGPSASGLAHPDPLHTGVGGGGGAHFPSGGESSRAMAVNLIRAHREELMQASPGRLDHLVIDVVGSLFDQVLSDARVPPQMARQIARLQLPVLRVALNDTTFFSSRRHPVRRFVNRIASLALAYDDFNDGIGKEFLERVRALVQEIVEGDFDQIELYANKLNELESFIGQQTQGRVEGTPAAATLEGKETELRLQQRYMMQLQAALAPVPMAPYLREFLAQVWSQALLQAQRADGPASERGLRFRRAARDLVMSVQPKGSPPLRKKFLMQLPALMKDLNEGMALIGWPEPAKKEFFGKLLPAHAESLKGAPLSELDYNMMAKQVEAIFNVAVPGSETLSAADPVPEAAIQEIERRFTPEEARQVNLVQESAVDWDGKVDIDLTDASADTAADEGDTEAGNGVTLALGLDVNLEAAPDEPPVPSQGAALFEHIRLGFAYQMHLKDHWQKVRLTYVSPARSFFVFTHGKRHQETISMTSRMLSRMCDTGRMRAFESAYLLERATNRARKQLAALKPAAQH